ncbi:hypothetical protein [Flavobacterium sp.]|uniref:hypothetical protein n=1 Tax=Flavobacterium sp. TaxID=239 RepID=UPI003D0C24D3
MNQTESKIFEIKNKDSDPKNYEIQKEMKRLGFYYAYIDAKNNKITFNIQGSCWTGTESAEEAFVYTNLTFFTGTSYPVSVWIEANGD